MFLRARDRQIRLPRTQYSLTVLRGQSIRTVSSSAKLFWSLAALVPLSLAIGLAGSGGLALERWAVRPEIEIVQIRGAADADAGDAASRAAEWQALLRRAAIETEVRDLLAREARLEQREAMVAALAAEAARGTTVAPSAGSKAGVSAIGAIERLSPRAGGEPQRAGYEADGGRAYAPSPGVIQEPKSSGPLSRNDGPQVTGANFSASRSLSGPWTDVDAESGLDVLRRSLSRVESDQMTSLDALDRTASQSSSHNAAILADAGLDPTKLLAPNSAAGAGGPYVPAWTDADAPVFDRAVVRASRDVAFAAKLRALMPYVPSANRSRATARRLPVRLPYRSVSRPPRPPYGRRSPSGSMAPDPRDRRRPGRPCRANRRLWPHGRDRPRRRPVQPLCASVRSGWRRRCGRAGRGRRESRLDRPRDRTSPALRGENRRRTG